MMDSARRIAYAALGALAAYAWHRLRDAAPPGARIVVDIPADCLPRRVLGFGVEVLTDEGDDDGGVDETTGLPWGGRPGGVPDDEQ